MIGYILVDGGAASSRRMETAVRTDESLLVFKKESKAYAFIGRLELSGLEVKDLMVQKVSIKPIYDED